MGNRIDSFVSTLALKHRVLMLGGMAVVKHGLPRYTKDLDIWLEPLSSAQEWSQALLDALAAFPEAKVTRLFPPRPIDAAELPEAIKEDRVIRIIGFETPLDVFREPNELENCPFDQAYNHAEDFDGNFKLLSAVELMATKENTGRQHDAVDIQFLQGRVRETWTKELLTCDVGTAERLLSRYMDHSVLEAALANPNPHVHALGRAHLRQFAEEGDPFAIDSWNRLFGPL